VGASSHHLLLLLLLLCICQVGWQVEEARRSRLVTTLLLRLRLLLALQLSTARQR
jgi:hypothetical protein